MIFGATMLADTPVASLLRDPGPIDDPLAFAPMRLYMRNTDMGASFLANKLEIVETIGQPSTCRVTLYNPPFVPEHGDRVLLRFHDYPLFVGSVDRVQYESPDLVARFYVLDCLDQSFILMRRRINRNFVNQTIHSIVTSVLQYELAGESLSIGRVDTVATIPMVDADHAPVYDVFRDLAAMTGQILSISADGRIQFLSESLPSAPKILNESNFALAGTRMESDREVYRNVQTVVVTGTPSGSEEANTHAVEVRNDAQIAERAAIEGGSGRYEATEQLTHPTSNDPSALKSLAVSVAHALMTIAGSFRAILTGVARGYGFHAGQIATVDLPTFGLTGTYQIQRIRVLDEYGTGQLRYDLDLVSSGSQVRAWERWLSIVRQGKVIVQPPGIVPMDQPGIQVYDVPGTYNFVVPGGVTLITIESMGGSGGGGGAAYLRYASHDIIGNGGKGGNSGKTISSVSVVPGETLTVIVGSRGNGGLSRHEVGFPYVEGNDATDGAASLVLRGTTVLNRAYGGTGGKKGKAWNTLKFVHGAAGVAGGGSDGIVSVGGGRTGGARGTGSPFAHGKNGVHGIVTIRW